MKKKGKILVLGADGFLGSNLIKSLVCEKEYSLRAFDVFKNGETRNLADIRNKIEIFPGNFLNREDIRKSLKDVDYVFHFVSVTTPASSMQDPIIEIETNIRGTLNLFEECCKKRIKKIFFASSGGAIYGNLEKKFFSETDATNPISPYAISKLAIERYLEYFRLTSNLDYLILRYSNPFGPGQNMVGSQGIIPIFLNLIKKGERMNVFGDGKNVRDFIYIDDAIENTRKLFKKKNTKFRIYNIGSGKGYSINEVIKIMRKYSGKKIKIAHLPARKVDVARTVLDVQRVRNEIEYQLKFSLDQGIRKTWDWVKQQ